MMPSSPTSDRFTQVKLFWPVILAVATVAAFFTYSSVVLFADAATDTSLTLSVASVLKTRSSRSTASSDLSSRQFPRTTAPRTSVWVKADSLKASKSAAQTNIAVVSHMSRIFEEMTADFLSHTHAKRGERYRVTNLSDRYDGSAAFFARHSVLVRQPSGALETANPSAAFVDVVVTHSEKESYQIGLDYTLASVLTYAAPMLRNVWVITSNSTTIEFISSRWRTRFSRLNVSLSTITHEELFAGTGVTNITEQSVENALHRVPGLSAFFLHFNDGMVLGRHLSIYDVLRPRLASFGEAEGEQFLGYAPLSELPSMPPSHDMDDFTWKYVIRGGLKIGRRHAVYATAAQLGVHGGDPTEIYVEFEPLVYVTNGRGLEPCAYFTPREVARSAYAGVRSCGRSIHCRSKANPVIMNANRERVYNHFGVRPEYVPARVPQLIDKALLLTVVQTAARGKLPADDVWVSLLYLHASLAARSGPVDTPVCEPLQTEDDLLAKEHSFPQQCVQAAETPCHARNLPPLLYNYAGEKLFAAVVVTTRQPFFYYAVPGDTRELHAHAIQVANQVPVFVTIDARAVIDSDASTNIGAADHLEYFFAMATGNVKAQAGVGRKLLLPNHRASSTVVLF